MVGATRTKAWGLSAALLAAISFGGSGPFGKALIDAGFEPLQAVWLRVAGATVLLVPIVLVLRGRDLAPTVRRFWPHLLAYGLAGVAGCQGLYFIAASRLPVGVAILLEFTGPVLVVGWIRVVRGVPLARSAVIGVGIALIGLACVVQVWSGTKLDPVGLAAGLGAAACQAVFFLVIDRLTGDVDTLVMTAAGFVLGALALTAVALPWTAPWQVLTRNVALGGHSAPGWLLAGWLVGVSTLFAYLAGVVAVQRLSAPIASAVGYVEAVAATLIAWVVLGERLAPVQLAGGAIVLVGAFVAQRAVAPVEPAVLTPPELPVPSRA
jgi:drug/metabolite transporter (DMT)-like permease